MDNFYDKVAKKFGGYAFGSNKPKYSSEYPNGNPEEIFKEKLLKLAKTNMVCLDVGCGDGKFTFEVSKYFSSIKGIDTSRELLNIAESKKKALKTANVTFKLKNAVRTFFPNESFNIIFCRRGPSFYKEYYRLLKKGGYYLEIGIGEKDKNEFIQIDFRVIYAESIIYNEYYNSIEALDRFLQGVPIFEDFNPDKDRTHLETYCKKFKTPKGILLPRQRVVYVIQK